MASRRVLLVEDEGMIALALAFSLELAGYEVVQARNGRDAIGKIEANRPDVIVTDYMMPVMDGGELIRWIRARPEFLSIPIIVTTALTEDLLRSRATDYSAYLSKPVRDDALLAVIERLLGR
jgi:two-component system response regulator VicR